MKSQKLFSIALIIFTLVATSCSNQRFAHLKKVKVNQTEIAKATPQTNTIFGKNNQLESSSKISLALPEKVNVFANESKKLEGKSVAINIIPEHKTSKAFTTKIASKKITKLEKMISKQIANPKVSDQTLLLVILSLFPILALIAIYIKDGKTITTNFWIDLILHFTVIGYAIFAILVVLDIINLA